MYKTAAKTFQQRIRGLGLQYSPWRHYEEPLQPSCLGKNKATHKTCLLAETAGLCFFDTFSDGYCKTTVFFILFRTDTVKPMVF